MKNTMKYIKFSYAESISILITSFVPALYSYCLGYLSILIIDVLIHLSRAKVLYCKDAQFGLKTINEIFDKNIILDRILHTTFLDCQP